MKRTVFAACVLSFLSAPCVQAMEIAHFRLIEWAGDVQVMDPDSGDWSSARSGAVLRAGSKVRTGEKSFVDFTMDDYFENVLRLGEGSRFTLLSELPARVSLDQGMLMVLREDNHVADRFFGVPPRLRILTRDLVAEMAHGGCSLQADARGVVLKVFGDSVKVSPKTDKGYSSKTQVVAEGFRYDLTSNARMTYEDYKDWQAWYKQNDKRKDRFAEKIS